MHPTVTYGLALFLNGAFAQTLLPDSQATQSVLTEIRQLRHDLQITAATIQRVQIVMYRLQAEAALMDRRRSVSIKLALDAAKDRCSTKGLPRKSSRRKRESGMRRIPPIRGRLRRCCRT